MNVSRHNTPDTAWPLSTVDATRCMVDSWVRSLTQKTREGRRRRRVGVSERGGQGGDALGLGKQPYVTDFCDLTTRGLKANERDMSTYV